jgi:hypothetical protein
MDETQLSHGIPQAIWGEFGPQLEALGLSEAFP